MSHRGSGWANWETYTTAARPILEQYIQRLHRLPDGGELWRDGHGWIVFAAKDHHGNYHQALQRMNLQPTRYRRTGPRPPKVYQRIWWAYWPKKRRQAIFTHWPTWVRAGIMPPSDIVRPKFPGLRKYWYQVGSWEDAARELGLRTVREVRRENHQCESLLEALAFFESHGRWPKAFECGWRLRRWRFRRKTTWGTLLGSLTVHPRSFEAVRRTWLEHLRVIRQKYPSAEAEQTAIMNKVFINHYHSQLA